MIFLSLCVIRVVVGEFQPLDVTLMPTVSYSKHAAALSIGTVTDDARGFPLVHEDQKDMCWCEEQS